MVHTSIIADEPRYRGTSIDRSTDTAFKRNVDAVLDSILGRSTAVEVVRLDYQYADDPQMETNALIDLHYPRDGDRAYLGKLDAHDLAVGGTLMNPTGYEDMEGQVLRIWVYDADGDSPALV